MRNMYMLVALMAPVMVEAEAAGAAGAPKAPPPPPEKKETVLGAEKKDEKPAAAAAPEGEKKDSPADPAKKEPEKPAKVVPEKYELKTPDGSLLDPKHIEALQSYAKEKGLSNDEAQALLERESGAVAAFARGQQEAHKRGGTEWTKRVDGYEAALKADKELGGEAFAANAEIAKRAIDRFAPELKPILDETGFGSHPDLFRAFHRIGKAMEEDKLVNPGSKAPGQGDKKSTAEKFYGGKKEKDGE